MLPDDLKNPYLLSTPGLTLFFVLTILSGFSYITMQWLINDNVSDSIFVGLLLGASLLLCVGLGEVCVLFSNEKSMDDEAFSSRNYRDWLLLSTPMLWGAGIVYGLTIALAPVLIGIWDESLVILVSLSTFLFFVNFLTGIAFISLISILKKMVVFGSSIQVDLWQLETPSTIFLSMITRKISVYASVYIGICMFSILVSKFDVGNLIIGYAIFAFLVLASAILIPMYPIQRKLSNLKSDTLREIDKKIHFSFENEYSKLKDNGEIDLSRFDSLNELRGRVASVSTFPFRIKTLSTGGGVLFFTFAPVVFDHLLAAIS